MRFALLASITVTAALVYACSSDETPATPSERTPTYEKDVYPILRESCALTGCHGANTSLSNPDAGPPRGVFISPIDKDITYEKLINVDSTYFKGTKLILPGDPDNSLVMRKMDGTQDELESCPGQCGTSMPPPEEEGVSPLLSEKKRNKIRNWIAAGAENN